MKTKGKRFVIGSLTGRTITQNAAPGSWLKERTFYYVYDSHYCYRPMDEFIEGPAAKRRARALCDELNEWHERRHS